MQGDPSEYRKHARALAEIEPLVERFRQHKDVLGEIEQAQELARAGDADMRALAEEELVTLHGRRDGLLQDLKLLLVPEIRTTRRTSCSRFAGHRR